MITLELVELFAILITNSKVLINPAWLFSLLMFFNKLINFIERLKDKFSVVQSNHYILFLIQFFYFSTTTSEICAWYFLNDEQNRPIFINKIINKTMQIKHLQNPQTEILISSPHCHNLPLHHLNFPIFKDPPMTPTTMPSKHESQIQVYHSCLNPSCLKPSNN